MRQDETQSRQPPPFDLNLKFVHTKLSHDSFIVTTSRDSGDIMITRFLSLFYQLPYREFLLAASLRAKKRRDCVEVWRSIRSLHWKAIRHRLSDLP